MRIDGRELADNVFDELKQRVEQLQQNGVIPNLTVILVGEDPASETYVTQKELRGKEINVEIEVLRFPESVSEATILDKIRELNLNQQVHGIIVQRPLPEHINPDRIENEIADEKDVDGFKPGSPYNVPLVLAVMKILQEVYKFEIQNTKSETNSNNQNQNDQNVLNLENSDFDFVSSFDIRNSDFAFWLKTKKFALLGKGSTAGQPIIDYYKEIGANYTLIDSRTENPQEITKAADIIISSVGKPNLITPDMIKPGAILIGVGINKDANGQLHGDYDEEQIKDIASFYTPTPGGVGPLNVAMLLSNLVIATEKQTNE